MGAPYLGSDLGTGFAVLKMEVVTKVRVSSCPSVLERRVCKGDGSPVAAELRSWQLPKQPELLEHFQATSGLDGPGDLEEPRLLKRMLFRSSKIVSLALMLSRPSGLHAVWTLI